MWGKPNRRHGGYTGVGHDCSCLRHGVCHFRDRLRMRGRCRIRARRVSNPDGRPGASILIFGVSRSGLESQLISRIGQSIMTCPTTACYNGLDDGEQVDVGGKLKFFGDSYQASKMLGNRRFWRIPVMDGEFLVEQKFCIKKGVGGGNLLIISKDVKSGLEAAQRAVGAMKKVPGAIMPFPAGSFEAEARSAQPTAFSAPLPTPLLSHAEKAS